MKFAFHQILLISLLEQCPKCPNQPLNARTPLIYHVQPCNVDKRRLNVAFTTNGHSKHM